MQREATLQNAPHRNLEAPKLDRAAEVVISALKPGAAERFELTCAAAREVASALESLLSADAVVGRTDGLLDLVRLAQTLEHKLESAEAADRLRSVLRASPAARAVFERLEGRHAGFRDSCEKYAGTSRRLPATVTRPAEGRSEASEAGFTIRAALLMTPGELEARRVRPSFTVQRLRAACPLPQLSENAERELPRFAVAPGFRPPPETGAFQPPPETGSRLMRDSRRSVLESRDGGLDEIASERVGVSKPRMRRRAVYG